MNPKTLGAIVKARRLELRIEQRTVADLAGVAVHTLSNLEQSTGNPSLDVITRVLDVLGLELVVQPRRPGAPPS